MNEKQLAEYKAEYDMQQPVLDCVSKKHSGRGRITSFTNGYRYFVTPNYTYDGNPWGGTYVVYIQRKTAEGNIVTGRKYIATANQVKTLIAVTADLCH